MPAFGLPTLAALHRFEETLRQREGQLSEYMNSLVDQQEMSQRVKQESAPAGGAGHDLQRLRPSHTSRKKAQSSVGPGTQR